MYKFKEVQCPKCKHLFAWLIEPIGKIYRRKGIDEELFSTVCPNCALEMAIPSDSHEGIDVQDDRIEQISAIRGI